MDVPRKILNEFERRAIVKSITDSNPEFCKELKFEDRIPSAILNSLDEFRDRLLTPEEASIEAGELNDSVQIAHAEFYSHYDAHLTKNAQIDYPRMIQFAVRAFALDAEVTKITSSNSITYLLMSFRI